MKKAVIAAFAFSLAAAVALAQHGDHGGMMGDHRGPGGPGGPGPMGGGHLIVSSTGEVFVTSMTSDSAGNETITVTAYNSSGAKTWSSTLPSGSHGRLVLSGNNLITESSTNSSGTVTTTLTALSTATGAVTWTLNVNGFVTELTPFSGGTYAVVITPAATSGGTATRSLEAISPSGTVLWTVSL